MMLGWHGGAVMGIIGRAKDKLPSLLCLISKLFGKSRTIADYNNSTTKRRIKHLLRRTCNLVFVKR